MSDCTDWLAYLEAEPHHEPYLSIARAWRIDRGNLSLAEEGLANYQQEVERLHSTLAYRLQELDNAKWLIRNGEKHFGSLWRDATAEDINAITRRAPPQSAPHK